MSGPTLGISDADLAWWDGNIYAAIDRAGGQIVYLTQNLQAAGAATWTVITPVDVNTFERSNLFFGRIKFAPTAKNTIFVTGYADGTSVNTVSCWIFISNNLGLTWHYYLVRDNFNALQGDYLVEHLKSTPTTFTGDPVQVSNVHKREGDDDNSVNPWAMALRVNISAGSGWVGTATGANSVQTSGGPQIGWQNQITGWGNWLLGDSGADGYTELDEYFGAGNYNHSAGTNLNMPKEANRVNAWGTYEHGTEGVYPSVWLDSWVFWHVPQVVISFAFDVARNNSVLYIGFLDAIYCSIDAGCTWQAWGDSETTGEGAYDLIVDPLIYGCVYYWSAHLTDTHIFQSSTKGVGAPEMNSSKLCMRLGGAKTGGDLAGSWPSTAVNRIQKWLNSGKMIAIELSDTWWSVFLRDLGSNTTVLGGALMAGGTMLSETPFLVKGVSCLGDVFAQALAVRYFHQDKLILVDRMDIYTSDDGGSTWAKKKGGWTGYQFGVVGHRIIEEA